MTIGELPEAELGTGAWFRDHYLTALLGRDLVDADRRDPRLPGAGAGALLPQPRAAGLRRPAPVVHGAGRLGRICPSPAIGDGRPQGVESAPRRASRGGQARGRLGRRCALMAASGSLFDESSSPRHSDQTLRLSADPTPARARGPVCHPLPAERCRAACRRLGDARSAQGLVLLGLCRAAGPAPATRST